MYQLFFLNLICLCYMFIGIPRSIHNNVSKPNSPFMDRDLDLNLSTHQNNFNQIICENITKTLAYVKRIEGKLERIEALLSGSGHLRNGDINNDIFTQLPMKTISDVEEMERKCTTDTTFEIQMVILLFY